MKLDYIRPEHERFMEHIRSISGVETNAQSFYSCFLWQKEFGYKIHIRYSLYAIKVGWRGDNVWYFPVGSAKQKVRFIQDCISEGKAVFRNLNDRDIRFMEEHFPNLFRFEECPDNSEYLYDSVEYKLLSGKRFSGIRRIINRFTKNYRVTAEPISEENLPAVKAVLNEWARYKESGGEANTKGDEGDEVILQMFKAYQPMMFGVLIRLDGRPASVVVGYPLTKDTFDIVLTKSLPGLNGMGYVAVREFMKYLEGAFRYFNLEEDMGIPGLRTQKERMKPCRKIRLWKASMRI